MNKNFMHGVLLILLLAMAAFLTAGMGWCKALTLSPMIVGILIGMVYANTLRTAMPSAWAPGLAFCAKRVLRIGIILYGFRLTLADVASVGGAAIAVDALVVVTTIGLGLLVGRWLKMERELTLLTSCGSAICGAAAVLGAEGAIRAKAHHTAVAVSTVVIFGTIAMFLYPVLGRSGVLGLDAEAMGLYTGATVHEVAHVVGAGNAMGPVEASTSIIVKMMRVMMLVPVLLVLAFGAARSGGKKKVTVPWFAVLFLAVIVFNSLVPLPAGVVDALNQTSTFCLTMAMTALGAETTIDKFRQSGVKPFVLAAVLWAWLLVGGYGMVLLIGGRF